MAVGEGALWVTNASDGTVSRIDLQTNETTTIQVAPAGDLAVDAIAVGGGAVWVTSQGSIQLARIDPATNQVVATFSLNTPVHELVFGGGALWGRGSFSNTVVRVDPATNTVVASIDVPPPVSIVYLNDAVWSAGMNDVSKIDPATNTVVATIHYNDDAVTPYGIAMVAAGGSLWISAESLRPTLIQIDPASAEVVARPAVPDEVGPFFIAGGPNALFICPCFDEPENLVWLFDLETQELEAALNVPDAYLIIYDSNILWTYSRRLQEVTRVDLSS
jgi:DNA-binding beta-propeller fold protein YncE